MSAPLERSSALRHPAFWLLPALLAAYVWLAAGQLSAPLVWDEVNFFWNGQAIAETGVPYANAGFLGDRGAVGSQYQYGLWHPPLYLYTLGLAFKLFGASEAVARGAGVTLMTLTAVVVYLLGLRVIPVPARDWGALLAVAIFLVSPLVIQSALVLDIDGTVLTLLLAAWSLLYLCLADVQRRRPLALLALALAFGVALWAKLTSPFFLLAVVLVYQTLRGHPLRGVLHLLFIGVVGGALFVASWHLVCHLLGLPFDMPLEVTWAELHDAVGTGEGDLLERIEPQALPILAWVSPYLVAVFVGAVVGRVAALARRRQLEPVDFLLGVGVLVCAVYFVKVAAGFPKYHVAMMPFWAVVIAHWLSTGWARLPQQARPPVLWLTGMGFALALVYALVYVGDGWMFSPQTLEAPDAIGLALLVGFFLVVGALFRTPGLAAPLAAATLVLYGGWAASVDWHQSRVPYSTNYWYGSMGQREMARVVDGLLTRYGIQGPYIGSKDVVFYTRNHFFLDQDTVFWLWGERGEQFDGRLLGYDIPLVVAWVREPWVRHIFTERLADRYEPFAEVHDYLVFVRRPPQRLVGASAPDEELTADAEATPPAGQPLSRVVPHPRESGVPSALGFIEPGGPPLGADWPMQRDSAPCTSCP